MLVVVIAASRLITGERFIMCFIVSTGSVPKAGADRVEDAYDDPNGAGLMPVDKAGGHI